MKIKFDITNELKHKFNILMQNELGLPIRKVDINDIGSQYQFEFCDNRDGGRWHFELDKNPFEGGECYTLHCSSVRMNTHIESIKDLKTFCSCIAQIQRMQLDHLKK